MKKIAIIACACSFALTSLYAQNQVTKTSVVCDNGLSGFKVLVTNTKNDNKVEYDSCVDDSLVVTITDKVLVPEVHVPLETTETDLNRQYPGYEDGLSSLVSGEYTNTFNGMHGYYDFSSSTSFGKEVHVGNLVSGHGNGIPTDPFTIYKSDDGENWEVAYVNEVARTEEYVHEMDFTAKHIKLKSDLTSGWFRFYGKSTSGLKGSDDYNEEILPPWDITEL